MRHSMGADFCLATALLAVVSAIAMAAAPPHVQTKSTAQTQLYIRSVPADASVQIDGKSQGTAPLLIALPPGVGTVVVEVELSGFQSKTREILVRGGRITRVELKLREAVPAAKQSPTPESSVSEAQVEPGKLGRLDLRIVPTRAGDSKVSLSASEIKQYEKQLQQEGPFVGRDRGDDFGWFQLRCHDSSHLIAAEHAGRRFVLLSNRPAEVMLAIGWRSGPWKLHGVVATDDHRGLPSITIEMAHRHGFEYPSDIGVHPFGSKGTPSQRVPGR